MSVIEKLDKKEISILNGIKRRNKKSESLKMYWIGLIVLALVFALWVYFSTSVIPESGYKTFMDRNAWLYIVLFFVVAIVYLPINLMIGKAKYKKEENLSKALFDKGLTADELMEIKDNYFVRTIFDYALKRRMEELNITEVPKACYDGYEIYRLPTKEDIE